MTTSPDGDRNVSRWPATESRTSNAGPHLERTGSQPPSQPGSMSQPGSTEMQDIAERLDTAADALRTVDRALPAHTATAGTFAATEDGLPGRLGRDLHAHWQAVLNARCDEATEVAGTLHDLAAGLRLTAKEYADTDDAAARRIGRQGR
jgi:uncharacterized protein YukE